MGTAFWILFAALLTALLLFLAGHVFEWIDRFFPRSRL
jgi:hypothetical protein